MSTFVAADMLLHSNPSFDAQATAQYFLSQQGAEGLFRALGPEAPWLTAAIVQWLEDTGRSVSERFRWPSVSDAKLDRKTALPFFAYFDDLARLSAHVPGIATAPVALASLFDPVGFHAFNNRYGQDLGDAVLAEFASALRALPCSRAIRDGGDEFLLVGAPHPQHSKHGCFGDNAKWYPNGAFHQHRAWLLLAVEWIQYGQRSRSGQRGALPCVFCGEAALL